MIDLFEDNFCVEMCQRVYEDVSMSKPIRKPLLRPADFVTGAVFLFVALVSAVLCVLFIRGDLDFLFARLHD